MTYSVFQLALLLFIAGFAQGQSGKQAFLQGRIEVGTKGVTIENDSDHSTVRIINPEPLRGEVGHEAVLHGVWTKDGIQVISTANIDGHSRSSYNSALTEIVAQGKDAAMVDYLLRLGADPNVRVDGVQPLVQALHIADGFSGFGAGLNLEIVTILLDHGADPNVLLSKESWQTPLMAASIAGDEKLVQVLLDHKANVNIGNWVGATALLYARKLSIMKLLIAAGAPVNDKDILGRTSLHYATSRADPDAVAILIAAGANVNAKDDRGTTALDLAKLELQGEFPDKAVTEDFRNRVRHIVDLLRSAGAVPGAE